VPPSLPERNPEAHVSGAVGQSYPGVGQLPIIDQTGLDFLHGDVQQACICLGEWTDGQMQTRWLGRQAMQPIELWSTTKLVPLLNVVARANAQAPDLNIRDCYIRQRDTHQRHLVYDLATDIMTYDETIGTSNAIAAMLKLFTPPLELEHWLQTLTGNTALEFRGRYGEPPFFDHPELWHPVTDRVLLTGQPVPEWQDNTVATYDLTRLMSMVGWHCHLTQEARIPDLQWSSLIPLIQAMGQDSARYLDVAIATLGLAPTLRNPVILSKLGYGRSSIRDRSEIAYTAFVQWWDSPPSDIEKPVTGRSMALTLLVAKDYGDFDREVAELDARMATEVTGLVRRLAQNDWD